MNKELIDINYWCSPYSLLVVLSSGELKRLFCPFKVKVIGAVESFRIGTILEVVKVKIGEDLTLIYIIDNRTYSYRLFSILEGSLNTK